jgi:hypothetical integral membrane protein (TIGR02206 family)
LITPTPVEAFPSVQYVRYFAHHGILILNGFYVLIALAVPLTFRSVLRSVIVMQAFEILVGIFDWISGQNFMYLREKPPSPTIMDLLGPWPYYLIGLEFLAVALFFFWWGVAVLVRKGGLARRSVV